MMVECIHHWYLGASHNEITHAKCLKCGAEKDYPHIVVSHYSKVGRAYYHHKKGEVAPQLKPQIA